MLEFGSLERSLWFIRHVFSIFLVSNMCIQHFCAAQTCWAWRRGSCGNDIDPRGRGVSRTYMDASHLVHGLYPPVVYIYIYDHFVYLFIWTIGWNNMGYVDYKLWILSGMHIQVGCQRQQAAHGRGAVASRRRRGGSGRVGSHTFSYGPWWSYTILYRIPSGKLT